MMNFTNDEMNLMCIYNRDTRKDLIDALDEIRGYLDEDEAECILWRRTAAGAVTNGRRAV